MKSSAIPITCSLALTLMTGAVVSVWWPVRGQGMNLGEFASLTGPSARSFVPAALPRFFATATPPTATVALTSSAAGAPPSKALPAQAASPVVVQNESIEKLVAEIRQLKQANVTLLDQIAEINRDLMQLEFRVDTHSESFRPLPTSEDGSSTPIQPSIIADGTGVLPPKL